MEGEKTSVNIQEVSSVLIVQKYDKYNIFFRNKFFVYLFETDYKKTSEKGS